MWMKIKRERDSITLEFGKNKDFWILLLLFSSSVISAELELI
jgi:hypothetical protein